MRGGTAAATVRSAAAPSRLHGGRRGVQPRRLSTGQHRLRSLKPEIYFTPQRQSAVLVPVQGRLLGLSSASVADGRAVRRLERSVAGIVLSLRGRAGAVKPAASGNAQGVDCAKPAGGRSLAAAARGPAYMLRCAPCPTTNSCPSASKAPAGSRLATIRPYAVPDGPAVLVVVTRTVLLTATGPSRNACWNGAVSTGAAE